MWTVISTRVAGLWGNGALNNGDLDQIVTCIVVKPIRRRDSQNYTPPLLPPCRLHVIQCAYSFIRAQSNPAFGTSRRRTSPPLRKTVNDARAAEIDVTPSRPRLVYASGLLAQRPPLGMPPSSRPPM